MRGKPTGHKAWVTRMGNKSEWLSKTYDNTTTERCTYRTGGGWEWVGFQEKFFQLLFIFDHKFQKLIVAFYARMSRNYVCIVENVISKSKNFFSNKPDFKFFSNI